jgi:hypothetical protein
VPLTCGNSRRSALLHTQPSKFDSRHLHGCRVARHPGRVSRDIPDNLGTLSGSFLGLVALGRVDHELGQQLAVVMTRTSRSLTSSMTRVPA